MAYEGSLAEVSFAEVLQHVGRIQGTGILTLQGREEIIGVTFLDGEVVSVDAVNQAPEDGLGHVLEERALVTRDDFSSLVAENQSGGGRVIDLLVERGYLGRQQLLDALRQQTLRLCAEACAWNEGRFRFYLGDQVSYEHGIEPLGVDDLLTRLATDGEGFEPALPEGALKEPPPPGFSGNVLVPEANGRSQSEPLESEAVEVELFQPPTASERVAEDPPSPPVFPLEMPMVPPVEMPDVDFWSDQEEDAVEVAERKRASWFESFNIDWEALSVPVMPGRLLGIAMLASLVALVALAPTRFLVPLEEQQRIREGIAAEIQDSLYGKVDEVAKVYFLLRGNFPDDLAELVGMNLLAERDMALSRSRRLAYTEAPVSYLLAIEGEATAGGAVRTETISGNFLLDPDFLPPELVDSPVLVLLD